MGKREKGKFERSKNDLYDTPMRGVLPLLPFLQPGTRFIEPCFGNGFLAEHLQAHGHICVAGYDIEPRLDRVVKADARTREFFIGEAEIFATNPPWTRRIEIGRDEADKIIWEEILHPVLTNLSRQLPTWALFDADWAHTEQAGELLDTCSHVVSVGRLKWIVGSKHQGFDNCAWYRFDSDHRGGPRFYGRGNPVENPVIENQAANDPPLISTFPPVISPADEALFQRISRELSPISTLPLQCQ